MSKKNYSLSHFSDDELLKEVFKRGLFTAPNVIINIYRDNNGVINIQGVKKNEI